MKKNNYKKPLLLIILILFIVLPISVFADTRLTNIEVVGDYKISPQFNPNQSQYTVSVPKDVNSLEIKATPQNSDANVEIIGADELEEGTNNILIRVTDKDNNSQTYHLKVKKAPHILLFLGIPWTTWFKGVGFIILLGLLLLIVFILIKKKDDDDDEPKKNPTIEFKPEFNIGIKDNQEENKELSKTYYEEEKTRVITPQEVAQIRKTLEPKEEVYDPYDEVVTKDELFDAIQEAKKTKDTTKLKLLYAQELLNRKKEEMKKQDNGYHR